MQIKIPKIPLRNLRVVQFRLPQTINLKTVSSSSSLDRQKALIFEFGYIDLEFLEMAKNDRNFEILETKTRINYWI